MFETWFEYMRLVVKIPTIGAYVVEEPTIQSTGIKTRNWMQFEILSFGVQLIARVEGPKKNELVLSFSFY